LFAVIFGCSALLSLVLALYPGGSTDFGFAIAPEAAQTLTRRIQAIRLFGIAFAVSLMLLVVFGRSRGARGALGLRWVLGLATSVAFLRGIGVVVPLGGSGTTAIALSILQLVVEGVATLLLYGDEASEWFERRTGV
jgi:hypothetical protein